MELKFTVEADALRAALDVIQIVAPAAITTDGGRAFLFLVGKKANGEDACWVYSRDGVRAARAELPIRAVEGEGPFAYRATGGSSSVHLHPPMLVSELATIGPV
jgi:hypothetical protein